MIIQDLRAFSKGIYKTALPVWVFAIILFFGSLSKAFSQVDSNRIDFHKSSFFDFYVGGNYNNSYDLNRTLILSDMWGKVIEGTYNPVNPINPKFNNQRFGQSVGISGFHGLERGVLIGGAFNYTYLGSNNSAYAKTNLSMLGLSFNMGKVVYNFNSVLMHVYAGIGFSQYLIKITNNNNAIPNKFDALPNEQLLPHSSAYYHATVPVVEIGYGVRYRIKDKITVGVTGGIYFSSLTQGNWATGAIMGFGSAIDAREAPTMDGVFLRIHAELWRKGTKIYAGPREFKFDSIGYKRMVFVEDSTAKAEAAAKKGVVFENKYKREMDIQDSLKNAKGFAIRIRQADTSAKAMAEMPQPIDASGPAQLFIPATKNVVTLSGASAMKASAGKDAKKEKGANDVNSQTFNFNRVLETNKLDTNKTKSSVKPTFGQVVVRKVQDTTVKAKESTSVKTLLGKKISIQALTDSLIKATAAKTTGKDSSALSKKQKPLLDKGKNLVKQDTLLVKRKVKPAVVVKPPLTAADSVRMKTKLAADLQKRKDIIQKYKKDSLLRLVKQSQAELEDKYRKGLIKNDTTNKVVKLIKQSRKNQQESAILPDSVAEKPATKDSTKATDKPKKGTKK